AVLRAGAVEGSGSRLDVSEVLEAWDPGAAVDVVGDAAERAALPLLASALYAARPPAWEFGLGVVCAVFDRQRLEQQLGDDDRERESQIAGMAEAPPRAQPPPPPPPHNAEVIHPHLPAQRPH